MDTRSKIFSKEKGIEFYLDELSEEEKAEISKKCRQNIEKVLQQIGWQKTSTP